MTLTATAADDYCPFISNDLCLMLKTKVNAMSYVNKSEMFLLRNQILMLRVC